MRATAHSIRDAKPSDAPAIAHIYAPFVRDTWVTFETEVPTEEAMAARVKDFQARHAFLVAVPEGYGDRIMGYAYGSPHRARAAYQWSCEVSVYVDPKYQRQGLATSLYRTLFDRLRERRYLHALAGIGLPNDPSVALHEGLGFAPVAVYPDIGFKLGQWRSVGWWHKALAPLPATPPLPQAAT